MENETSKRSLFFHESSRAMWKIYWEHFSEPPCNIVLITYSTSLIDWLITLRGAAEEAVTAILLPLL